MNSIILENINDLFDPYDLFSYTGKKKYTVLLKQDFPIYQMKKS